MTAAVSNSPDGTVLVTGASGFVGSAVANQLRERGWRVRTFVRKGASRFNLDQRDEIAEGDVRDRQSVAAALRDVRHLIHVAADYRLWARDPGEIFSTNVEGARILMEEALRAGVERVVYTSSVATLATGGKNLADETCPMAPDAAVGAYKQSKIIAERLVETMVERDNLPAIIVNPSTPIGPRDIKPTPTGRIIVEAACGRMPAFVDTGLNLAHVDDVARGHLAALERGRIGERYILGGDNVALSVMLAEIAGLVGRKAPRLRLAHELVYPFACGAELLAHLTGKTPFATRDGLRMARKYMFVTDAKARKELGYTSRPHIEALSDAIAWFRGTGFIK